MLDFVKLNLIRSDVCQILDGLTERLLVWKATAEYIETGYPQSADCVADCGDAQEAEAIAHHYQYIIDQINRQLDEQKKSDQKTDMRLFIRLFHGRKDPGQDMDDWGFDGPIFGPYIGIQGVYCNWINLTKPDGSLDMLRIHEDLVYYDESYYGDWCILTEPSTIEKTTVFQQDMAEIPNKDIVDPNDNMEPVKSNQIDIKDNREIDEAFEEWFSENKQSSILFHEFLSCLNDNPDSEHTFKQWAKIYYEKMTMP